MRKNSSKQEVSLYRKTASKMKSWSPVNRNGWAIKFSTHGETILLIFFNLFTDQTVVRFFSEETEAVQFINMVLMHDSADNKFPE